MKFNQYPCGMSQTAWKIVTNKPVGTKYVTDFIQQVGGNYVKSTNEKQFVEKLTKSGGEKVSQNFHGKHNLRLNISRIVSSTHWYFSWRQSILLLLSGIYNPYKFEPPHSGGSDITHKEAPQSVGLLWTSDQPVAETSTWQHTQHSWRKPIHSPGGIRTRNPSKRWAVDTRLRPLDHWDRHGKVLFKTNIRVILEVKWLSVILW